MKKVAAGVCLLLALAVMGWWAKDGMLMATRTKIPVDVVSTDEFGDQVKITEWQEGFELGLMDGALPAAGGLAGLAALLLFLEFRGRRREAG